MGKGGIRSATELATRLLHEAHVVTVPGEAFGTAEHIRISYPVTRQNIDEGTRRMGEFLTKLAISVPEFASQRRCLPTTAPNVFLSGVVSRRICSSGAYLCHELRGRRTSFIAEKLAGFFLRFCNVG